MEQMTFKDFTEYDTEIRIGGGVGGGRWAR